MPRRSLLFLFVVALVCLPIQSAHSANYPGYPVQFIISFPPGGPGDTTIRIIHPALQKNFGGAIQLVNKPGAGGAIAYTYVKKAKPDGYTILSTMSAPLTVERRFAPCPSGWTITSTSAHTPSVRRASSPSPTCAGRTSTACSPTSRKTPES